MHCKETFTIKVGTGDLCLKNYIKVNTGNLC